MMYKGILDTSMLIRTLAGDVPDKEKKFRKLLEEAMKERSTLFVPLIVVFEFVFVLEKVYKLSKKEVRTKAESLLSISAIQIEEEALVLESLRLHAEDNMKFGDAMVLAKARLSGIKPVYTFDAKDFKKVADAIVL